MKYRFRPIKTDLPSRIKKGDRFRLMGKDKLKKLSRLPVPIEQIDLENGEIKAKRRKIHELSGKLKAFFANLGRRILRLIDKAVDLINRLLSSLLALIPDVKRKNKTIDALPVLVGASVASVLVVAVSAGYIMLSLFSFYQKSYETVTVPDFIGRSPSETVIDGEKFNLIIDYAQNDDVENGKVIAQYPSAGVTRRIYSDGRNCDIVLTVSKRETLSVPSGLIGRSLRDASLDILNEQLNYKVAWEHSSAVAKGRVIRIYPLEGVSVEKGDTVTLTVSAGKKTQTVIVPDLRGLNETEATNRLYALQLAVGEIKYTASDEKAGTVVFQSVSPNTSLPIGSKISLTVSVGNDANLKKIPNLYGLTLSQAKAALRDVGLTVGNINYVSSAAKSGLVLSQYPKAGTAITSDINSVDLDISTQ